MLCLCPVEFCTPKPSSYSPLPLHLPFHFPSAITVFFDQLPNLCGIFFKRQTRGLKKSQPLSIDIAPCPHRSFFFNGGPVLLFLSYSLPLHRFLIFLGELFGRGSLVIFLFRFGVLYCPPTTKEHSYAFYAPVHRPYLKDPRWPWLHPCMFAA